MAAPVRDFKISKATESDTKADTPILLDPLLVKMLEGYMTQNEFVFKKLATGSKFFNDQILKVIIFYGVKMQKLSGSSSISTQMLKNVRDLFDLLIFYVNKCADIYNKHVFTIEVLENQQLVEVIRTYSLAETD